MGSHFAQHIEPAALSAIRPEGASPWQSPRKAEEDRENYDQGETGLRLAQRG